MDYPQEVSAMERGEESTVGGQAGAEGEMGEEVQWAEVEQYDERGRVNQLIQEAEPQPEAAEEDDGGEGEEVIQETEVGHERARMEGGKVMKDADALKDEAMENEEVTEGLNQEGELEDVITRIAEVFEHSNQEAEEVAENEAMKREEQEVSPSEEVVVEEGGGGQVDVGEEANQRAELVTADEKEEVIIHAEEIKEVPVEKETFREKEKGMKEESEAEGRDCQEEDLNKYTATLLQYGRDGGEEEEKIDDQREREEQDIFIKFCYISIDEHIVMQEADLMKEHREKQDEDTKEEKKENEVKGEENASQCEGKLSRAEAGEKEERK